MNDEHPHQMHDKFELKHHLIQDEEKELHKSIFDKDDVVSPEKLKFMKYWKKVNCLHKGTYDNLKGKSWLICVDGSEAAQNAFDHAISLVNKDDDHVFIVTIRQRANLTEPNEIIVHGYKLFLIAKQIIEPYGEKAKNLGLNYTLMIPQADDPKSLSVALVKRYNIDTIVIGKHSGEETKHHHHGHIVFSPGFSKYVEQHTKVTVMIIRK